MKGLEISHKKNNFFLGNIGIYILKSFKSHIKNILCHPFKLKYLNQKTCYPALKKYNIFLVNM